MNLDPSRHGEPLHPDLVPYLETGDIFPILRHPLVFQVPYFEQMAYLSNQMYQHKLDCLVRYKDAENWEGYVWAHERPYRLQAFTDIREGIDDKTYWALLGSIYIDSENIGQLQETWRDLLSSSRPNRSSIMNSDEMKTLSELPETIKIYRGGSFGDSNVGPSAMSWTTSKDVATWFANRFSRDGGVIEGTVNKSDVLAYFSRRGEEEIFVFPEHVALESSIKISDTMNL